MRDINRIPKVLEKIKTIWEKYPDLRLGQLISNVLTDPALYYVEDNELCDLLESFYEPNTRD